MKRKPKNTQKIFDKNHKLELVLLASSLVLVFLHIFLVPLVRKHPSKHKVSENNPKSIQIQTVLMDILEEFNINDDWILQGKEQIKVSIPSDFKFYEFYYVLKEKVEAKKACISSCKENMQKSAILITLSHKDKVVKQLLLSKSSSLSHIAGKMAIIIDDFGYTYNETVKEFIFLKYPITLSIIPGLKASKRIARDAALAEKEYIIHLPMEPLNEKYDDHGYTIRTDLDDEVIRFRVRAACSNLPDAAGVNNHQGSKVTADQHIMNIVINELAKQGKYFIDSRTTQNSVAYHTARNHNIKTAENQLFLDARNDQDFISEQIQRLAQLAVEKGSVVAIGHVRENTLKVLERKMAELDSRGIEFVHASDIVH